MGRAVHPHIITDDSALGGSVIERSLRFNRADNAKLSRANSTNGDRQKWTFSFWIKYAENASTSNSTRILARTGTGSNRETIHIYDGTLNYQLRIGNSVKALMRTDLTNGRIFTDQSAWSHIVVIIDTANSTTADRVIFYKDGVRLAQTVTTNMVQNSNTYINSTSTNYIGNDAAGVDSNMYLAECHFLDGYAYDPSYFGYTESQTGIWQPKKYEGAYGSQGWYLKFDDNSDTTAATLGKDSSGNGNNWTPSGFAVSDSMLDTPTNNFSTYDPLAESGGSYSEGNLKVVSTADPASSTIGFTSGKFYFEVYVDATNNMYVGVIPIDFGLNPGRGGGWNHGAIAYKANGDQYSLKVGQSSVSASYGASYTAGDIIGCAVDIDNDTITFYKNGVSQGNTTNGVSYMSPTGAKDQTYGSIIYCNGGNNIMRANFGQDSTFQGTVSAGGNKDASGLGDFKYAVPSGYNALCSKNLPPNVPSIIRPQKHFDTVLYTGNGSSNGDVQRISSLQFDPDFVWIKSRSASTTHHQVFDVIRSVGGDKALATNLTNAEYSFSDFDFLNNGFNAPYSSSASYSCNTNSATYVAWCWKAGGTAVTNNDGTITSQVSVNEEAGFSIISYTGNNTNNATVGHGLGKTPALLITKNRDNTISPAWHTSHVSLQTNYDVALDGTDAAWNPSTNGWHELTNSSVFTLKKGSSDGNNTNRNGDNYIAYCWTEIPGYSKFGSYTGNGNANGVYVHLGFRPAWIMTKRTDGGSQNWLIHDIKRDPHNVANKKLAPNLNSQENNSSTIGNSTNDIIDILSDGFKMRSGNNHTNINGGTFIFIAFAEQPGLTPYGIQTNAR